MRSSICTYPSLLLILILVLSGPIKSQDSLLLSLKKQAFQALKQKEYEKSKTAFLEIIHKYPDDHISSGLSYNNLAIIHNREGLNGLAIQNIEQAHLNFLQTNNDTLIAKSFYNSGTIYKILGQYDTATALLFNALHLYEKHQLKKEISQTFNLLGNVNKETGDLDQALTYHNKALDKALETNDTLQIGKYLNNRGSTYKEMEDFPSALISFQNALKIKNLKPSPKSIANTLYNIGEVFLELNQYDSSNYYFLRSLEIRQEKKIKRGVAYCYNQLGNLQSISGNWTKAEEYFNKTLRQAKAMYLDDLIKSNYEYQQKHFERKGDLKKSLSYFKLLSQQREKQLNKDKQKAIEELQIKYDTEKKNQENELLSKENRIKILELQQQEKSIQSWRNRTILIAGLLLFAIFLIAMFFRLFQKEKILSQREKRFAVEQHHRIKNNLQVLSGMLSLQHRKLVDMGAKEAIEESKNRVTVMSMLHQSLYNEDVSVNSSIELDQYIQKIVENLLIVYGKTSINTQLNLQSIDISTELALPLGLLINEIISNSLKHGTKDENIAQINVDLKEIQNEFQLTIGDNGEWISPQNNASSIGIDLIHQMVKQMNGKLNLDNKDGTTYSISIPNKKRED